jgi:multicomponent Na+:H+ antiporter subunit C
MVLLVAGGVLCACGAWLILDRHLSRVVIGIGLLGHGVNVLLVLSGGNGGDPAFAGGDAAGFADPLPQAMVLTAIVITFGVIAFLLALAHRSWAVTGNDEVEDDLEDRRVAAAALEEVPDPTPVPVLEPFPEAADLGPAPGPAGKDAP